MTIQMPEFMDKLYQRFKNVGLRIPLVQKIWTKMRRRWKQDPQISKKTWETQYLDGHWDYLKNLEERGRYTPIVSYFQYFKLGGSILDVGCGEGILQELLGSSSYSKYLGVDLSEGAISRALPRQDEKTFFISTDAATYDPRELFDTIVFNETLYYFEEPLEVLKRYERYLAEDGIFIVSIYFDEPEVSVWKKLKTEYHSVDEITTSHQEHSWVCNVFVPSIINSRVFTRIVSRA